MSGAIDKIEKHHLAVFRLQGNLPFNPKPRNPDDGGTLLLLLSGDNGGCASRINILSALDIGTGMRAGTGGPGKPCITPPAVSCKGDAG